MRQARIKDFRFNISIPYLSHNEISMIAKHDFKISDSDKLKDCKTVSREVFVNDIIEKLQKKIEILEKALEGLSGVFKYYDSCYEETDWEIDDSGLPIDFP